MSLGLLELLKNYLDREIVPRLENIMAGEGAATTASLISLQLTGLHSTVSQVSANTATMMAAQQACCTTLSLMSLQLANQHSTQSQIALNVTNLDSTVSLTSSQLANLHSTTSNISQNTARMLAACTTLSEMSFQLSRLQTTASAIANTNLDHSSSLQAIQTIMEASSPVYPIQEATDLMTDSVQEIQSKISSLVSSVATLNSTASQIANHNLVLRSSSVHGGNLKIMRVGEITATTNFGSAVSGHHYRIRALEWQLTAPESSDSTWELRDGTSVLAKIKAKRGPVDYEEREWGLNWAPYYLKATTDLRLTNVSGGSTLVFNLYYQEVPNTAID